jgi:hypothetical protein
MRTKKYVEVYNEKDISGFSNKHSDAGPEWLG